MRAFHRSDGHLLWEVNPEKHGQVDQAFRKSPSLSFMVIPWFISRGGVPKQGSWYSWTFTMGPRSGRPFPKKRIMPHLVLQQTSGQWRIWALMRDHVRPYHGAAKLGMVHQKHPMEIEHGTPRSTRRHLSILSPEGVFLSASLPAPKVPQLLGQRDGNWSPLWSGDQQMSNHYASLCITADIGDTGSHDSRQGAKPRAAAH